ncbi:MAG: hypothetical protein WD066_11925 [Planctomycetaceae bacterium]
MSTTIRFAPVEESWWPEPAFPGELFAFLGINRIDHAEQTEILEPEEEVEEDEGEFQAIITIGDPRGLIWQKSDLSIAEAVTAAEETIVSRWTAAPCLLRLLTRFETGNFGERLHESLLRTVDPAVHDGWSPWDCSLGIGPKELRGHAVLRPGRGEILIGAEIPGYLKAGDVLGEFTVRMGEEIDDDAEKVVGRACVTISFSGDGSPIGCAEYLAQAARDPVLRRLLDWLDEHTDTEWSCCLEIT